MRICISYSCRFYFVYKDFTNFDDSKTPPSEGLGEAFSSFAGRLIYTDISWLRERTWPAYAFSCKRFLCKQKNIYRKTVYMDKGIYALIKSNTCPEPEFDTLLDKIP